jgi:ketosteroid isomerase-like protein
MADTTFRLKASAALLSCALAPLAAAAKVSTAAPEKAAIVRALGNLAAAFAAGESPEKIADMIYAPDIVILGEGTAPPLRGMPAALAEVRSFMDALGKTGERKCSYEVFDPVVASASTFSSLVTLHCNANPPSLPQDLDVRMICVWKKLPQGWRIVLEMWAPHKL